VRFELAESGVGAQS